MSSPVRTAIPRRALAAMIVATVVGALAIGSLASGGAAPARDRSISPNALAFHDAMRALWESHGTWTERAIVGGPDTPLAIARLLQNQTDIGNASSPTTGPRQATS